MEEAVAFLFCDDVQALLPLHFLRLAAALEFVDVVGFVVDDHDVVQTCEVFQLRAAKVSPVQHAEVVACCFARAYGQQLVDHSCDVQLLSGLCFFFHLVLEQVPVGQSNQSVACRLAPDAFFLRHDVVLYEGEDFLPIVNRDEDFLIEIEVVGLEVASFLASCHPSTEGIQQAVIDDEAGCHNEEVLGEASAFDVFPPRIQHLPQQQGVHHPRLACACCHLHGVLRHPVLRLTECAEVERRHQVGRHPFIILHDVPCAQHFVEVDDVEDGLPLTGMEVATPEGAILLREPEPEQFRSRRRHLLQQFTTRPGFVHHFAQPLCQLQRQRIIICIHNYIRFFVCCLRKKM